MTPEQIALYGGILYLVLSFVSGLSTFLVTKMPNPPAWLSFVAKWSGVIAVDLHKLTEGGGQ